MLPNPTMACLLIALAIGGTASAEDWVVTKDSGAYRVNGCKLMADGRLVSASGTTTRLLSRQQLDEIGAAIERYESSHTSPYASPAIAGPTKTANTEEHPIPPVPSPVLPVPTPLPDGGPDWPEGYPRSDYNLAHKIEILAQEAEKARMAGWQPCYTREGLLPLFFMAGIFLGLSRKIWLLSALSACLWLGLILIECQLYGDKVLGAFLAFSMINLFISFCFLVLSFICLGGAKMFAHAFPVQPPRPNIGNGREQGQGQARKFQSGSKAPRRYGNSQDRE